MSYEFIVLERDEGVGTITMNRPRVLNALNRAMYREIDAAISELEEDDSIAAIVITGAGERAFSAGADIHEMARIAEETGSQDGDPDRARHMWHLATCAKPTIGAINGLAYGGGAVIAASMDIRVGSETCELQVPGGGVRAGELDVEPAHADRVAKGEGVAVHGPRRQVPRGAGYRAAEPPRRAGPADAEGDGDRAGDSGPTTSRIVKGIKELMIRDVGASWHEMQVE